MSSKLWTKQFEHRIKQFGKFRLFNWKMEKQKFPSGLNSRFWINYIIFLICTWLILLPCDISPSKNSCYYEAAVLKEHLISIENSEVFVSSESINEWETHILGRKSFQAQPIKMLIHTVSGLNYINTNISYLFHHHDIEIICHSLKMKE